MKDKQSRRRFIGSIAAGLGGITLGGELDTSMLALAGQPVSTPNWGFMIHGGAGVITRDRLTPQMEAQYRAKLKEALSTGFKILETGGPGLDAVEAAIRIMEDSSIFNAGRGAVFTNAGTNELDSSIMDGKNLKAGAVASLKHVANPISLARLVMEQSRHVMMVGEGAEAFAQEHGVKMVPQSYFFTETRWKELQEIKAEEKNEKPPEKTPQGRLQPFRSREALGTVGAVALDKSGNLAAGTSTGGLTNKRFGRVGDSPIIGAGTYANNLTCAISATGDGEYFIRSVFAHDVSAMIEYRGLSAQEAVDSAIGKVGMLGGTGGAIVMDRNGRMAVSFNTEGMYRAYANHSGEMTIEIYKN